MGALLEVQVLPRAGHPGIVGYQGFAKGVPPAMKIFFDVAVPYRFLVLPVAFYTSFVPRNHLASVNCRSRRSRLPVRSSAGDRIGVA